MTTAVEAGDIANRNADILAKKESIKRALEMKLEERQHEGDITRGDAMYDSFKLDILEAANAGDRTARMSGYPFDAILSDEVDDSTYASIKHAMDRLKSEGYDTTFGQSKSSGQCLDYGVIWSANLSVSW